MSEKETNRTCRNCNVDIPLTDNAKKKFCSNRCRNNYNIAAREERDKIINQYILGVKKNHKILKIWETKSKLNVTKKQLLDNGFSFDYLPTSKIDKTLGKYYQFGDFYLFVDDDNDDKYIFVNSAINNNI